MNLLSKEYKENTTPNLKSTMPNLNDLKISKPQLSISNKNQEIKLPTLDNNGNISKPLPVLTKEEIKILEWRFNQFLGEKLSDEEMKEEENQSYVISEIKMTNNGNYVVVGDKGGRIILFKKQNYDSPKKHAKLQYFYEFSAYDKDFDVHKSTEYSETVRAMCVLPMQYNDKIDILSCGYRSIKLHRVYNSKTKSFTEKGGAGKEKLENTGNKITNGKNGQHNHTHELKVPKLRSIKSEIKSKCKKNILLMNSNEINSLSYNKFFTNQFICSDENKVLLWDLNHTNDTFCLIDLEEKYSENTSEDYQEKITKSVICEFDPHMISFGTNCGNIRLCDTRTNSDCVKYATNFIDEFLNITNSSFNLTKTVFSSQIMSVHDLNFNLNSENLFASRHYLSVNIWDRRNNKVPVNRFLVYEPIINKLSYLYLNNYIMTDKFSLSADKSGKFIMTGGYNNMFHIFDVDQRLNTQITLDSTNEKIMNTNIIRKINSKGSCYYKKDDPAYENINYNNKITKLCYSPVENYIVMSVQNCMFTYNGNYINKETSTKK
jgi:serine/threonine-protein phosphatase 2A regulatory subunit B